MVASMAMWGLANPFSDIAMDALSPAETYVIETGVGGLALIATVLLLPQLRPSLRRVPWRISTVLGLIMPGFCFYLGNIGYEYCTVTTGVVLLSTEVIFTALGGVWLLREHMSRRAGTAIAFGMAGAIAVGIAGQSHSAEAAGITYSVLGTPLPAAWVGALAFILSSVFSGLFAVLVRRHAASTDTIGMTVGQLTAAMGLGLAIYISQGLHLTAMASHRTSFTAAALAGLLGSAFAFLMFNSASKLVPTRQTALTLNLIPVIAIVLGGALGRGWPTGPQLVGAVVVLGSLLFLESTEHVEVAVPAH
jgi:drug/metabolite transporter (DMT)-like permease